MNQILLHRKKQLNNEADLLERVELIQGLTLAQLAHLCNLAVPHTPAQRKGWAGQAIELALGTTAGNQAIPDFNHLGIEVKTIPLKDNNKPAESTFITSISLLTISQESWKTSACYQKLKRILWIPLEGSKMIPFLERRIGHPFLWSPTEQQELVLAQDWQDLTAMICLGKLEEITAAMGEYLQIRPKAANARSLCYAFDAQGHKIKTLPRGFYLRNSFTYTILKDFL